MVPNLDQCLFWGLNLGGIFAWFGLPKPLYNLQGGTRWLAVNQKTMRGPKAWKAECKKRESVPRGSWAKKGWKLMKMNENKWKRLNMNEHVRQFIEMSSKVNKSCENFPGQIKFKSKRQFLHNFSNGNSYTTFGTDFDVKWMQNSGTYRKMHEHARKRAKMHGHAQKRMTMNDNARK